VEESPTPIQFKKSTLQSKTGKKRNWVLTSKAVRYDEKNQKAVADEVMVEFYNTSGKKVLTVKAIGATADLKENSLKFKGSVMAENSEGDQLFVKELRWDGKKKKLIGEKYVKIIRRNAIMTAKKMIADPELKQVELSDNVKIIYPDIEKFINF
jgi:LPS export ABC transporter protein LptC